MNAIGIKTQLYCTSPYRILTPRIGLVLISYTIWSLVVSGPSDRSSSLVYPLARVSDTMTDYTTLPMEAHDNRSVFVEHAWNIGRAYRNQALELISMCRLLSRLAPPKFLHEDAELRRILRVCDLALRSAANSGTEVTDEANARFKEATRLLSTLSGRSGRRRRLHPPISVHSRMKIARQKDRVECDWSHARSENKWGPTTTINFVLLRSPLLSPHDPETIVVSQELSADASFAEILWNLSRYKGRARITLEQNPHFYLRCPVDESAYTPTFRRRPLQDPSGALEHNDTVYVLFDRPGRVFLDNEHKPRIFGNVWSLNGFLIFRDNSGVIEGQGLVIDSNIRGKLWFCEQPVVYDDDDSEPRSQMDHSYLRPILTTLLRDRSADGAFEDWTVLSRPASHSINIHLSFAREISASTSSLDLAPPPPTSERPGYPVHYTTINTLNGDILLNIFDNYRLDDENGWNVRLGWRKISQVCQRWRHLAHSSAFHLGMHIICTNGTSIADMLDHLPPLPLFVNYRFTDVTVRGPGQDELGIRDALRLRDRVRRIDLHIPSSILQKILMLMNEPFPILEHLSLSSTVDNTTTLTLPVTFLAPNLRHLALLGIGLPKRLRLLSSTASVVTLVLTNIQASGYFRPRLLVARLQSLPQLEELSIGFSIPIPRPGSETELLGKQGPPVTLPNLKDLTFQGVSAYLERFVAQIRAPLLERLDITLFNQIAFALPHLSHLTNITEGLKLPNANIFFERDEVSIITTSHRLRGHYGRFSLRVRCKQLDWQIDCAAQVCSALMPALSGVEWLSLDLYDRRMPTEWQDGEIDGTTWHELLRSFIGVKKLHICGGLTDELSRALQVDEIGLDPGFLPDLQELASGFGKLYVDSQFGSFIHAREAAGLSVHSSSTASYTIFYVALEEYENMTNTALRTHPLAVKLLLCNSPSDVLAVLDKANEFDRSRTHNGNLSKWLKPTINVLYAFSETLGGGAGLIFSPTEVIFTSFGVLLL
ncbi:hypothetical protein H4582DRAFT_2097302, partial [Lactarius indigo]